MDEHLAEELLLLRSSVSENEFFFNDAIMADEAIAAWESYLEQPSSDQVATLNLVLPSFSLRLQPEPEILLAVSYRKYDDYICSISSQLAREDGRALNIELDSLKHKLLDEDSLSSYPIFTLFTGLVEYLSTFKFQTIKAPATRSASSVIPEEVLQMKQVMFWSHHLLSTSKRKKIVQWSVELSLFGISRPGYPGIIMVEGLVPDVSEFVSRIRALQWKALQIRYEEITSPIIVVPESVPLVQHKHWARLQHSKLMKVLGVGDKPTVKEVEGVGDVGVIMKAAGLEEVFLSILKIVK